MRTCRQVRQPCAQSQRQRTFFRSRPRPLIPRICMTPTLLCACLPACLLPSPPLADSLLPPQALPLSAVTLPGQPASLDGGLSPAAAAAAASAKAAGAGIIIDAGFSACYVVPFYDGQLLTQGECLAPKTAAGMLLRWGCQGFLLVHPQDPVLKFLGTYVVQCIHPFDHHGVVWLPPHHQRS